MLLKGFESPSNSSLHGLVNVVETFSEIGRGAGGLPPETKSDLFHGSTSELKAKSSCDASRVPARRGKINDYLHIYIYRINTPARRLHYLGEHDILLSDRYIKYLPAAPSRLLKD